MTTWRIRSRALLATAVLALLVALTYANAFRATLTFDSHGLVAEDPRIRQLNAENLQLIAGKNYGWPAHANNLYRPLTTLSFLVNYSVLGNAQRPAGYHAVNLLLHWVNACLVLMIAWRLTRRFAVAALAAALFAVHPVNVEAVTNIAGRADLLATFGVLLAGACYLEASDDPRRRKWPWLVLAGFAASAGVLAKENAVAVGGFVVLYDWLWRWPRFTGGSLGQRWRRFAGDVGSCRWIAFGPAALLLGGARLSLFSGSAPVRVPFVDNPLVGADWLSGTMTAIHVIGRELALLLFPATLSCDYSYDQIPVFGVGADWTQNAGAVISLVVVVLAIGTAVRVRHSHPAVAWGVSFFFAALLPTSNLLFRIGSVMAERFLYLPSVGFCLVAALVIDRLATWSASPGTGSRGSAAEPVTASGPNYEVGGASGFRRAGGVWPRWVVVAAAGLVYALAVRAYVRSADWSTELTLWRSAVAAAPNSVKAHDGYAAALWRDGRNESAVDAAIAMAEHGLRILDRKPLPPVDADSVLLVNLGLYYRIKAEFLLARGVSDRAHEFSHRAVSLLLRAREVGVARRAIARLPADRVPANLAADLQLARAYLQLEHWDDAAAMAREAQRLNPGDVAGYELAAKSSVNAGRFDDAAVDYLAVLVLQPNAVTAWVQLARCYDALGVVPIPVAKNGSTYALDRQVPMVRTHLIAACRLIAQNYEAAGTPDAARLTRAAAASHYNIPPADLAP